MTPVPRRIDSAAAPRAFDVPRTPDEDERQERGEAGVDDRPGHDHDGQPAEWSPPVRHRRGGSRSGRERKDEGRRGSAAASRGSPR